jgi:hypothetical protein
MPTQLNRNAEQALSPFEVEDLSSGKRQKQKHHIMWTTP